MNKRIIAALGILIIVISVVFAGCGEKVRQEVPETTTDDGKIILNGGYDNIPEDSQIVIGSDGQSYLVDGEGNSVVYNPVIPYPTPGADNTLPLTTTTTTTKKETTTSTTIKVIPSTTTTTTTSQHDNVIKELTQIRRIGYNDSEAASKLPGYSAVALRVKFVDGRNTDWLVEFHKGAYGSSTVGCEIGIYTRPNSNEAYKKISDQMGVRCSAQLYGTDSKITGFGYSNANSGWRYSLVNGGLSIPSSSTVMISSIRLNYERMDGFTDALEDLGFREGSTSSQKNVGFYSVDPPEDETNGLYTVKFVW